MKARFDEYAKYIDTLNEKVGDARKAVNDLHEEFADEDLEKENEFIVKADRLVWNLYEIDKKITVKKIIGFSNVSIRSNNEVAFSDKGIYNNITEVCKLFGNVRLQRGDSFLTGEYAEVDLKSGISKILPAPKKGPNESKVRALIEKETKN